MRNQCQASTTAGRPISPVHARLTVPHITPLTTETRSRPPARTSPSRSADARIPAPRGRQQGQRGPALRGRERAPRPTSASPPRRRRRRGGDPFSRSGRERLDGRRRQHPLSRRSGSQRRRLGRGRRSAPILAFVQIGADRAGSGIGSAPLPVRTISTTLDKPARRTSRDWWKSCEGEAASPVVSRAIRMYGSHTSPTRSWRRAGLSSGTSANVTSGSSAPPQGSSPARPMRREAVPRAEQAPDEPGCPSPERARV